MKGKIGVLDSGIGGVSVLKEIIHLLPEYSYLYFSDSKNNPYGDKSKEEILKIVLQNVEKLIEKDCKIIVLACNTATAVAIDELRKKYKDICFVATEPAIKVAYDFPKKGKTLLLATQLTLETERVHELIQKYKLENMETYACSGLAELIEQKKFKEIENYLRTKFIDNLDAAYVVLGCTHYPLVKDIFQRVFPNAEIIDGSIGVSKQVARKVEELGIEKEPFQLEFIDTSTNPSEQEIFEYYYHKTDI